MPRFTKILIFVSIGFLTLVLLGLGIYSRFAPRQLVEQKLKPVELTWWGVFDSEDYFTDIISAYRKLHPNVSITFRRLRYDEYDQALLTAQAEGRGPDIFEVHNTSIRQYLPRLAVLPKMLTLPVQHGKQAVLQTAPTITPSDVRDKFVEVAADDVILPVAATEKTPASEEIIGLPLGLDTLVLYYNRDLLNAKGIATPPATWADLQDNVKTLTEQDAGGNILTSGAALGGSGNVPRNFDILSLLMMQNGTIMADDNGTVLFNQMPQGYQSSIPNPPGEQALTFYTDFARPSKEVYTWNGTLPNAQDLFVAGKLAYYFGYSYDLPQIRSRAPKLNFAIAPVPQLSLTAPKINFANYWVQGVSAQSPNADWAWDFIQFAAQASEDKTYLSKAEKPAALRELLAPEASDPDLRVQSSQVLTAKSWYRGKDSASAEKAFQDMIDAVVSEQLSSSDAINNAQTKIQATYR